MGVCVCVCVCGLSCSELAVGELVLSSLCLHPVSQQLFKDCMCNQCLKRESVSLVLNQCVPVIADPQWNFKLYHPEIKKERN